MESNFFRNCWQSAGKRALDVVAGGVGLCICAPLWLPAAMAIRLESRGPAFYRQLRLGRNGRPFRLLKLRTMVPDAEAATGPVWATRDDPRVTRVGRWLRRSHFDETPQFINVLRGEMSLIGPRPERAAIAHRMARVIPGYRDRLRVKPGITGLSQVRQRYDACLRDVRRKLRYDRLYMRKMCALLDLKILYLTVLWVVRHDSH